MPSRTPQPKIPGITSQKSPGGAPKQVQHAGPGIRASLRLPVTRIALERGSTSDVYIHIDIDMRVLYIMGKKIGTTRLLRA